MRQNRDWLKGIYSPTKIHVKISGKVYNPGIYEMAHGDQVKLLVEKAGGFIDNVDSTRIRLEAEVIDGQVIRIE